MLGLKLTLSVVEHYHPEHGLSRFLMSHEADHLTSAVTVAIFFVPVLTSLMFNYPKVREHR